MAFYDWNGNGSMDSFDSFMDYNICMGEDSFSDSTMDMGSFGFDDDDEDEDPADEILSARIDLSSCPTSILRSREDTQNKTLMSIEYYKKPEIETPLVKTQIPVEKVESTMQKPVPISAEERRAKTRTSSLRFLALFLLCLVISCFNETLASMVMIGYALIKIFYYQRECEIL